MHESGCRLLTLALSRLRVTSFEVGRQIQRDSKGRQLAQLSLAGASQRYLAQLLKSWHLSNSFRGIWLNYLKLAPL